MLLIYCEISLTLTWSANYIITNKVYREAGRDNKPAGINAPTNATFTIKDTKLYVPVFTLLIEDDNSLLQRLKTGFKRTFIWNKYRSDMSNQKKAISN